MHMLFSGRTCLDVFSCRNIADGIQHSDYENQFVYMRKIIISKTNPVIREILKFKLNPGKKIVTCLIDFTNPALYLLGIMVHNCMKINNEYGQATRYENMMIHSHTIMSISKIRHSLSIGRVKNVRCCLDFKFSQQSKTISNSL